MIDIPGSVRIGGHTYTIDSSEDARQELQSREERGSFDFDRLLIRIDPTLPSSAAAETLLHEILHAAWNHSSLPASGDEDHVSEEVAVSSLAFVLHQILVDNPEVALFIRGL